MSRRLSAHDLIDLVLDHGSWSSWDTPPARGGISEAYAAELATAAERSGVDESVEKKFPGASVTYGSAASGAGDNRDIPESEGGGVNPVTGQYVFFFFFFSLILYPWVVEYPAVMAPGAREKEKRKRNKKE